jgi:hypothetical protein
LNAQLRELMQLLIQLLQNRALLGN